MARPITYGKAGRGPGHAGYHHDEAPPDPIQRAIDRGPGTYRTACPQCARQGRDDALGVTVDPDAFAFWTCFRCGWSGGTGRPDRPAKVATRPKPKPKVDVSRYMVQIECECCIPPPGGPTDLYFKGRGLPGVEGISGLLEHPGLLHGPSGKRYPAMIGIVTDAVTLEPLTLHRTWITADGRKAPVTPNRMLLKGGRKQGGVIRLVQNAEVTLGLGIAEGIETAVAAMAAGFRPVWSTVDAGNMADFPVLPGIECLTVFVDNDPAGIKAFEAVARRWREAGREVRKFLPAEGDVNDWWRERSAA